MGQSSQIREAASLDLQHRIDMIARELPHLSPHRLAFAIDELRSTARSHGFGCVADLAHNLEGRIAKSSHAAIVLPFLDVMRDAASLDTPGPDSSEAYLAFMGLRLHG